MKTIVLITTGQPSTNPRIVKEADALQKAGFDVTVLYSFFISWASEKDSLLLQQVAWKYKEVGGSPTHRKGIYLWTRIRYKAARTLNRLLGHSFLLAERAQARAFDELLLQAKKIKGDWYIGHNLGALAIAVRAAKHNNGNAGFDFEDYHRGELQPNDKVCIERVSWLENKYMPMLRYFSSASEMITEAVNRDYPRLTGKSITLLNCFPLEQQPPFKEKSAEDKSLKLFWFSQTIGKNRGLENLIYALMHLKDPLIHLTLAGRCDTSFEDFLQQNAAELSDNIHLAGIIEPEYLPSFASQFDVGLALETGFSENNKIALSNKIFTYLLAGLAVILTETPMQASFNKDYNVGISFTHGDKAALAKAILRYKNMIELNTQKQVNYRLSKTLFNWNVESQKLLSVLNGSPSILESQ